MGLLSFLIEFAVATIEALGYPGVFLLMMLESMVFPVPSEGVMPFAGFLVADGKMNLWVAVIVATLGSIVGSSLGYLMGAYCGHALVERYGKYFFVSGHDLAVTERFFRRWGLWAVFVGRYVPVVRHLISIPAGTARMPWTPFLIATTLGAFGWNLILTYIGVLLGENWEALHHTLEPFDLAIAGLIVLAGVVFVVAHVRRGRRLAKADVAPVAPQKPS